MSQYIHFKYDPSSTTAKPQATIFIAGQYMTNYSDSGTYFEVTITPSSGKTTYTLELSSIYSIKLSYISFEGNQDSNHINYGFRYDYNNNNYYINNKKQSIGNNINIDNNSTISPVLDYVTTFSTYQVAYIFNDVTLIPLDRYVIFDSTYNVSSDPSSPDYYRMVREWVNEYYYKNNSITPSFYFRERTPFCSYTYSSVNNSTYYDGIANSIYNNNTLLCRAYSNGVSNNKYYAFISCYINDVNNVKNIIKPYAYTRFKYPSTIDRNIQCIDVSSYFSGDNGITYVQNGSVSLKDSTSKAGTTDIFTSMSNKCVIYDSPAYLQVSIVPSSNDDEKYIKQVNIHAYSNNGTKFIGTKTINVTNNKIGKYEYTQRENAYTFTLNVVTRVPQLNIKNSSDKKVVDGITWSFIGGALSKDVTTNNNGLATVDINNSKSDYAAIQAKSLSMPEKYRCLRPSSIYFKSNDFDNESNSFGTGANDIDYRNFSYYIGTSSIKQYNYDITAYARFVENDKIISYITPNGGAWCINVPNFSINYKTSVSYSTAYEYTNNDKRYVYSNAAYFTSMQIHKSVTVEPSASGYAYIGDVTIYYAKNGSSDKTKLVSFTSEPDSNEFIDVINENTIPNTTYVTYIDAMVCAYKYRVCFTTNSVGKYSVCVNNTNLTISEFSITNNTIAPITYVENINLAWAVPDNDKYEFDKYLIYAYVFKTYDYSGSYNTSTFAPNLSANTNYKLIDLLESAAITTLSPYELFVIEPHFKVTAAPLEVTVKSKAVGKEYDISINNTTKHVGDSSDIIVASMKSTGSITMGTIKPTYRQYSWNSGSSTITYTNSGGTNVTKTGIKENDEIKKPSDLSGELSSVLITPAFSNKTTFNVSFQRYKPTGGTFAPSPNYSEIQWCDTYISGTTSLTSGVNNTILDTLLPSGDKFGIESITLDDTEHYKITKIQSTIDNGNTWTNRTLGNSNAWVITANTTVMPIIEEVTKYISLNFLPVADSDYTVKYSVNDTAKTDLYVGKDSSGKSTDTFATTDTIKFKSITFKSKEYSINKITINDKEYKLYTNYTFKDVSSSGNSLNVNVTAKADYSKIEYKLNINAQNWTDNVSENIMYDVILSDAYFNLGTGLPERAYAINSSYVTIDSADYNNEATMTIPVTYVGSGKPEQPSVDIMFYTDMSSYKYKVKSTNYSPYTASYTDSDDYNWTVPVSKAFELNSQKSISYIVQVYAYQYNFRGSLVPYDVENQRTITDNSIYFGVAKGSKITYTLAEPTTVNIKPENYGIMVSKSQIEVSSGTWKDCKYKLTLSPTVIPIVKSYSSLTIFHNNSYKIGGEYVKYAVSVKSNGTPIFNNKNNEAFITTYYGRVAVPYKLNNPNNTKIDITITSLDTSTSAKSFKITYDINGKDIISKTTTGVLNQSIEVPPNSSILPALYIMFNQ